MTLKMVAWFVSIVVLVGGIWYSLPYLYVLYAKSRLTKGVHRSRVACITVDDGPGPRLDEAILRLLEEHSAQATFFLLGSRIREFPSLVRTIHRAGHEIGSHGYAHMDHGRVWPWTAISDIKRGWREIDAALGRHDGRYAFRPPYGRLNPVTLAYLWLHRVPIVLWTFDSGDTWTRLPGLEQRVDAYRRDPCQVILLHDFDRVSKDRQEYVLRFTEAVLEAAGSNGVRVTRWSDLT